MFRLWEEELAKVTGPLFGAEGVYRIHRRSAPGWKEAGEQRDDCQHARHGGARGSVPRVRADAQAVDKSCCKDGRSQSDRYAEQGQPTCFAKDEAIDVAALRAESHAHAHFSGSPGDGVADGTIHADPA